MLNIILWSFLKKYMRDYFLSEKLISPEKDLESELLDYLEIISSAYSNANREDKH